MKKHEIAVRLVIYAACGALLTGCASMAVPVPELRGKDSSIEIVKSPNDSRSYRYLVLDNELTAILVNRPEEGKAGAALAVARGSNHDLPEHPGIAHFLEHMLFLGTEKYPDPDEYSDFISKHGGSNNAYTSNEITNYFFDIDEQQFPEGLDRFAQFFVAPLLDADYVEREKNAVHSEYQMQMRSDNWRGFAVLKSVMNPDHPTSRFNIGSLETLADADRELVAQYYNDHYSADQMVLITVSQRSLDEQEALVRERFGGVPNRKLGDAPVPPSLFLQESLPLAYGYQTVMANRELTIDWPVPDIKPHYRTKPLGFIGNLLGHEGEGSLYDLLSTRGWANYLSAGGSRDDSGNSSFSVAIGLTDTGWQFRDEVHGLVFAYIERMSAEAVEEWRFNELAKIGDLNFRFVEQGSTLGTVNSLIQWNRLYEPADLLQGSYLYTAFDSNLIKEYLTYLTRENAITSIAAPDLETDLTEKWFNVPYTLSPSIDIEHEVEHDFELPKPNIFIPDDSSVVAGFHNQVPDLVLEDSGIQVWHALDTEFNVPRSFINVRLQYEEPLSTASDVVKNALLQRLIGTAYNRFSYPALISGLNGSFTAYAQGMSFTVNGYNDKQQELLTDMLDMLTNFVIDGEQLATQKTELRKNYGNFKDERGFQQAYSTIAHTLMSTTWAPSELEKEVDAISLDSLTAWTKDRLSRLTATVLIVGNSTREDALAIGKTVSSRLRLVSGDRRVPNIHMLDGLHIRNLNIEHDDSVYLLAYLGENDSIQERGTVQLIEQVVSQAYFNELRTEQQLGYATFAQSFELFKHPSMVFLVQSPVADVGHLQTATSQFIATRRIELNAMTSEEFDGYKQGLLASLLEKDKNLAQRSGRYLQDVVQANPQFNTREQLTEVIKSISLDELKLAYDRILNLDSPRRLEVFSPGKSGVVLERGLEITDPNVFKTSG